MKFQQISNTDWQVILRDIGLLLRVPAGMALLSLPVCIFWNELYAIWAFLLTAFASLSLSQLCLYYSGNVRQEVSHCHAMIAVALSWAIVPALGAIPFLAIASHLTTTAQTSPTIGAFLNPWNALFESFSGFTSTGLSVALQVSALPRSLQWWRSLSEWVGGVGIVVLALTSAAFKEDSLQLYQAEARERKLAPTATETTRRIWQIYGFYTVVSALLLAIAGMPLWDAINNAMAGISTGGFSVTDNSIGAYSPIVQLMAIIIMIIGAISFKTHYEFLSKRKLSALWQNDQHRLLWFVLGLGTLILLLENYWSQGSFLFLETLFHWVSALSTCGWDTVNLDQWSPSAKLLLSLAFIIGGAAGSTVGGIKLSRVIWLYKGIKWHLLQTTLAPGESLTYRVEGQEVTESEAKNQVQLAAILTLIWIGLLFVSVLALFHTLGSEYTASDIVFEAASALSSVGISVGITQPDLDWSGKFILMFLMWIGRLEIVPGAILIIAILSWSKQRLFLFAKIKP